MCTRNTPSLALSRQALRDVLTRVGWDPEVIFDAELALAELLVNAWRHGRTASPVVHFSLLGITLRVTVADESDALPEQRTPADFGETGRGLQLVAGLTHRWGVDPQKLGKSIWFELDALA
ncbi:ATP-binding protein [Kitasatospora sp. SUK 42]|uniref:ATP-binding protein n=1 Tax=Kitasatospora sp. SUK 42 TaxID=1588882 RepID=UPI001C31710A|nr:ATP-binding protein [Kitasatospora sp. SUK 42]MBV2155612.1 ATP-binding protein [Kitasatospora sp. SUK 42]